MSDDEINKAIAEACGLPLRHDSSICDGDTIYRCGVCGSFGHSNCRGNGRGAVSYKCSSCPCCAEAVPPNFSSDLNAMHEAEKFITEIGTNKWWEYAGYILRNNPSPFGSETAIHATACQRAEAFLRTIGKWKEEAK